MKISKLTVNLKVMWHIYVYGPLLAFLLTFILNYISQTIRHQFLEFPTFLGDFDLLALLTLSFSSSSALILSCSSFHAFRDPSRTVKFSLAEVGRSWLLPRGLLGLLDRPGRYTTWQYNLGICLSTVCHPSI